MFSRDKFLVSDRLARLHGEAERARLAGTARTLDTPRVAPWRVSLALALFALADVIARPATREDACADCI